jgi:hypothetical protein
MGLLSAICKGCKKNIEHFSFDNDITCRGCGIINASSEIQLSTLSYGKGREDGKDSSSRWLKSWMNNREKHNSLEDWYNALYSIVYKTKKSPPKFKTKISLHASNLLLNMARLKKEGMGDEKHDYMCEKICDVIIDAEDWEKEHDIES